MGRKKIPIEPIKDERNRHVTFNKRKSGLIKKAMELSILCNCQISLVIFNSENQLYEYCSNDPRMILSHYCQVAHTPHERLTNADYTKFESKSRRKSTPKKGKASSSDGANSDGGGSAPTAVAPAMQAANLQQIGMQLQGNAMDPAMFNMGMMSLKPADPALMNQMPMAAANVMRQQGFPGGFGAMLMGMGGHQINMGEVSRQLQSQLNSSFNTNDDEDDEDDDEGDDEDDEEEEETLSGKKRSYDQLQSGGEEGPDAKKARTGLTISIPSKSNTEVLKPVGEKSEGQNNALASSNNHDVGLGSSMDGGWTPSQIYSPYPKNASPITPLTTTPTSLNDWGGDFVSKPEN